MAGADNTTRLTPTAVWSASEKLPRVAGVTVDTLQVAQCRGGDLRVTAGSKTSVSNRDSDSRNRAPEEEQGDVRLHVCREARGQHFSQSAAKRSEWRTGVEWELEAALHVILDVEIKTGGVVNQQRCCQLGHEQQRNQHCAGGEDTENISA